MFIAGLLASLPNMAQFFVAATQTCSHGGLLFGLVPTWYEYLKVEPDVIGACAPVFNFPGDIWPVGLAALDIMLRLAGFIAVVSIIVAGVQYIISQGNQEKGTLARKRIQNSLIGLAIVLAATAVVSFVGRSFG